MVGDRLDPLIPLLVIFAIHNLIEFVGYALFLDQQTVGALFRSYYVVTIIGMLFVSYMALHISQIEIKWPRNLFTIWAGMLVIAILVSNTVVAGHYSIGYSLSAVKGDYYSAFALFSVIILSSTIVYLLLGLRRAESNLQQHVVYMAWLHWLRWF